MGQREPINWDGAFWMWGEDAEWARRQAQLHRSLARQQGCALFKAEQWAALDQLAREHPNLARQYDRFQAKWPKLMRQP